MNILKRILLAEDDPRDVELTLQGLRAGGLDHEVLVVGDGEQALDVLLRRGPYAAYLPPQPALVLLDLKMPKLNGLDVLREMRSAEGLACVPVVMLTSSREPDDVEAAYRLGASAFIVKPVGFRDYIETVKTLGQFWGRLNEAPPTCLPR